MDVYLAEPPPAEAPKSLPAGGAAIGVDAQQTQQTVEGSLARLFTDPLQALLA